MGAGWMTGGVDDREPVDPHRTVGQYSVPKLLSVTISVGGGPARGMSPRIG